MDHYYSFSTGGGKGQGRLTISARTTACCRQKSHCKNQGTGSKMISKHISYITRSGVEMDGKPARAFDEKTE